MQKYYVCQDGSIYSFSSKSNYLKLQRINAVQYSSWHARVGWQSFSSAHECTEQTEISNRVMLLAQLSHSHNYAQHEARYNAHITASNKCAVKPETSQCCSVLVNHQRLISFMHPNFYHSNIGKLASILNADYQTLTKTNNSPLFWKHQLYN